MLDTGCAVLRCRHVELVQASFISRWTWRRVCVRAPCLFACAGGSSEPDLQIRFLPAYALDPDAIKSCMKVGQLYKTKKKWPAGELTDRLPLPLCDELLPSMPLHHCMWQQAARTSQAPGLGHWAGFWLTYCSGLVL